MSDTKKDQVAAENQETAAAPEETQVTVAGSTAVAVAKAGSSYISLLIQAQKETFLELNEGLDLDYVRMGQYLKINKKGNFIEARDETVNFGDTLDVVVAQGELYWVLWGGEDTPEDGQLIVSLPAKVDLLPEESAGLTKMQAAARMVAKAEETARNTLENWLANTAIEDPKVLERYDQSSLQLRYLAYVVPVKLLSPEESPTLYLMNFAPGDTFGWGSYNMDIFKGKYKKVGVAATKVSSKQVVTRMTTEERKKDSTSWLGINFSCVGMFDPKDYGLNPDDAQV